MINVKSYGAKGDGVTDDTVAIRRAISKNINEHRYRCSAMLYFPDGTYLLSGPVESRLDVEGDRNAGWRAMLVLIGQSREGVVLKLKDGLPDYGDPGNPKYVVAFGSESDNAENVRGEGNRAFRHGLMNLTVDVGARNPGAIGVDFIASNRGAVDNVTIRAPSGSGYAGVGLTRRWPGPAIVLDTAIEGFRYGIDVGHYQYGMTFENITMSGQTAAGVRNVGNLLTMRNVTFRGRTPFYVASEDPSFLCLLDSRLYGREKSGVPALKTPGMLNLRRLGVQGYRTVLDDTSEKDFDLKARTLRYSVGETFDKGRRVAASREPEPLDLPIEEIPTVRPPDDVKWVSAGSSGTSLQRVIDRGAEYIYVRPRRALRLTEPVILRNKVRLIFGMNGFVVAPDEADAFIVDEGDTPVVQLENLYIEGNIRHTSTRTCVVRHCDIRGLDGDPNETGHYVATGSGKTHVVDVIGRDYRIGKAHRFWGRQVNSEFGSQPLFSNLGGDCWILGYKMESRAGVPAKGKTGTPVLLNDAGGRFELFGAFLYTLGKTSEQRPRVPAFTNRSGKIAISFRTSGRPDGRYRQLLSSDGRDTLVGPADIGRHGAALLTDDR